MNDLSGTGVALVTPFNKQKEVDFIALKKLVEYVINNGISYLVVMGTTAESPVINNEEKRKILEIVKETNNNRCKIIFGIGGNNTYEILKKIEEYQYDENIYAILSVTPYYNKPNQKGIIAHFSEIARNSSKPIIVYNVPSRTGVNMLAETTLELANKYSNIIAIKEASGNIEQIMFILKNKPKNFNVISGDDSITFPLICLGAIGVISVAANAIPQMFSEMVRLALSNDFIKARELHYKMFDFCKLIFAEGSPAGIKCAMWHLGLMDNELRLPLIPVSNELSEKIKNWLIINNLL
jgi:4-hydroxy-tetrahydrodipicolinate synthase